MKKYLLLLFFLPFLALSCSSDNKTLEKDDAPKEGELDPKVYSLSCERGDFNLLEGTTDNYIGFTLSDDVEDEWENLCLKDIKYSMDNQILELSQGNSDPITSTLVRVKALKPGTTTLHCSYKGLTEDATFRVYPMPTIKVPSLDQIRNIKELNDCMEGARDVKFKTTLEANGVYYTEAQYIFDGYSYIYTLSCPVANLEETLVVNGEVEDVSMTFDKDVNQMGLLLSIRRFYGDSFYTIGLITIKNMLTGAKRQERMSIADVLEKGEIITSIKFRKSSFLVPGT